MKKSQRERQLYYKSDIGSTVKDGGANLWKRSNMAHVYWYWNCEGLQTLISVAFKKQIYQHVWHRES
jgi:hypothetical protein